MTHLLPILLLASLSLSDPVLQQDQEEGGDSGYAGLADVQNAEPWVALFDGKSLEGWTTHGGRYDGDAVWTVENGVLTGREGPRGAGGLIYTEKTYRDFELEADVRITYPFDSGFFLRMTPPEKNLLGAQVTLDWRPDGEIGGIYCDGYFFHNPAGAERFKKEDWNHFVVRCVGDPMHLVVWMNGELLTDFRIPEQSGVFAKSGLIGLQVHGSPGAPEGSCVRFKNIRLRELGDDQGTYFVTDEHGATKLTEQGTKAGWRALFDGKSLAGWKAEGDGSGYRVRDGVLEFLVAGESPHLATVDDFQDFQLRMDFAITRRANSGLFLRAARDGSNPAFSGCEVQILDDSHWEEDTQSKLEPYQFTGGLYGSVPPAKRDAVKPLGEWNTYDITYHGSRIVAYLNGVLLYDVDTLEVHVPENEKPFVERAKKGFIGLQRHGPAGAVEGDAYARFRNIFVREL
jgi:hypothetical protein